jgi:hypothetical protein
MPGFFIAAVVPRATIGRVLYVKQSNHSFIERRGFDNHRSATAIKRAIAGIIRADDQVISRGNKTERAARALGRPF